MERCEAPTRHSRDSTLTENFTILTLSLSCYSLFNKMRTLKLKAQPTNAFFATVNQMFGGSSQLPTMLSELYSTI